MSSTEEEDEINLSIMCLSRFMLDKNAFQSFYSELIRQSLTSYILDPFLVDRMSVHFSAIMNQPPAKYDDDHENQRL